MTCSPGFLLIADIYIMLKTENCVILALAITDCLAFSLLLAVQCSEEDEHGYYDQKTSRCRCRLNENIACMKVCSFRVTAY